MLQQCGAWHWWKSGFDRVQLHLPRLRHCLSSGRSSWTIMDQCKTCKREKKIQLRDGNHQSIPPQFAERKGEVLMKIGQEWSPHLKLTPEPTHATMARQTSRKNLFRDLL